jgi:CDP-diacylglycerol pyrophosphatase
MSLVRRSAACMTGALAAAVLFAAPASCANRDALKQIVEEQCLVHWRETHSPAPCAEVDLEDPARPDAGYAVLADRKGGAHFLLIPTETLSGIESPALAAPGALNYFAAAWKARERLASVLGRPVPRDAVGLAVNPPRARSQAQLHIHIECLRGDVFAALRKEEMHLGESWTPISFAGANYWARSILAEGLERDDPLRLLAARPPVPGTVLGDYTLVVAGAQLRRGPGFILLASTTAAGELLLDSTCSAAADSP